MAHTTNRNATTLVVFIAFGGFLFGYDIGVISGCLIMPNFIQTFGELGADGEYFLSSSRQPIITSLLSAGTFVGALVQAFTSDRFGRRSSILGWSAVFTAGAVTQTTTIQFIVQITVGRFVAGLGVGVLSAIAPLYNGETAPKAIRGTLLVLYQLQVIVGIFISYLFDLGTHHLEGSASWRIPIGLQLVWGGVMLSGMLFLPESPRHLLGKGMKDQAAVVIARLNGIPKDDPLVYEIVEELQYTISVENEGGKATWAECFSTRNALWKRTLNGMILQFIQQLNGQNFHYYYGDTFFESAGTNLSPYVIQVILGAVSVAGSIPALYLIEKWGRRRSLLTGAVTGAICAVIAAFVGHYLLAPSGTQSNQLTPREKTGGDVLIAFALLHVFSFALFWGPTPIGLLILLIFFGILVFGYIHVYLFIPETKGLTLEEVDEMYTAHVKPWNFDCWQPLSPFRVQLGEDLWVLSRKGVRIDTVLIEKFSSS